MQCFERFSQVFTTNTSSCINVASVLHYEDVAYANCPVADTNLENVQTAAKIALGCLMSWSHHMRKSWLI